MAGENYRAAQRAMSQEAAQDADIQSYAADMAQAATAEDAQAARDGLAGMMYARMIQATGDTNLDYDSFAAALTAFGGGQMNSLNAAMRRAGLPNVPGNLNSVMAYAARQIAAGNAMRTADAASAAGQNAEGELEEAASLKSELKAEAEKLPSSIITIEDYQTAKQQKQIMSYLGAVDNRVLEAAQKYKRDKKAKFQRVPVAGVSAREAADIMRLTGQDVAGYTHDADRNFFNHVEKRHGENGEADQSMADLNDVARVAWVLKNYDTVNWDGGESNYQDKNDNPMAQIVYEKEIDGSIYIVEAVGENKWRKLHLVSARIQKTILRIIRRMEQLRKRPM